MPPDPVAFEGALNGRGPNLGQGLREPPPKAPGIVTPLGGSTTASVNTHGLGPILTGPLAPDPGGSNRLLNEVDWV